MTKAGQLRKENALYPKHLVEISREKWPRYMPSGLNRVWRSKRLLVQVFEPSQGGQRLSISRTDVKPNGSWDDDISWLEMQEAKDQAGFADRWAVEIFPAAGELVNVANMRHLWLIDEVPEFAWRRAR